LIDAATGRVFVISRDRAMHRPRQAFAAFLILTLGAFAYAGEPQPENSAPPGPVPILTTQSAWRMFAMLKPPMIEYDDGPKPLTSPYEWVDRVTPAAVEGWNKLNFSDAAWLRSAASGAPKTPYAANLCYRAKFEVTDPAQVKDLKLSLNYHGGAIVSVNGQEIARANLADKSDGRDALAASYPASVFVQDSGEIIVDNWMYKGPKEAITNRQRKLTDVAIPAGALKKGVNLLAIQIVRAPYHKVVADYWKRQPKDTRELGDKDAPYDLNWNTCQLNDVQLVAATAAGLVPNASRPNELQAWNSQLLTHDLVTDFGDRCEPLQPVIIRGPRNGVSHGKIVIGSPRPIADLHVSCGDLKQGAATIPADRTRARFAIRMDPARSNAPLDMLLEKPLATFPVGAKDNGAVVPIWFTVKIPKDAKQGTYTGQATVQAAGEKPLTVPISVEVADYSLPDTQDFRTWIELMQSPDSIAAEYSIPLWSDKHWQMIADSFRYMGETGSRVIHVPLIAQTNSGNQQSMVRWIKKSDGTYEYDFSIMDKYLDLAEKHMGKPKFVAFIAWEIYLDTPREEVTNRDPNSEESWAAARWDLRGKGPAVTALDPATGAIATVHLPRFEEKGAFQAWKPLFDQLRQKMTKRGLEKNMLLGMASDKWPGKEEMATLHPAAGGLKWINHTHQGPKGAKMGDLAECIYTAYVWPNEYPKDPSKGRTYGWQRKELNTEFRRFTAYNDWLLPAVMLFPEIQITGNQRGLGRIGADFWPVIKDRRGQRRGWVWDNYPQSKWHSCNLMSYMLNPGPDGPVASPRFEALREGVQQCEARIAIESALTNPALKAKLGAELADRAQGLLDDRVYDALKGFSGLQLTGRVYTTYSRYQHNFYYNAGGVAGSLWYTGSGWQDRCQKLYETAGEVNRKLGVK
jgi:hypothetical protein